MAPKKLIILVVDDSPVIRMWVKTMLLELKNVAQVMEAGNYEETLRILEKQVAQVLVLDLNLPGKNGIDILRSIGLHKWELTIIILTNQVDPYYKNVCLSLGAHYFLDKTKDFETMASIVEKL